MLEMHSSARFGTGWSPKSNPVSSGAFRFRDCACVHPRDDCGCDSPHPRPPHLLAQHMHQPVQLSLCAGEVVVSIVVTLHQWGGHAGLSAAPYL